MRTMNKCLLAWVLAAPFPVWSAAECFTMYDARNNVVYQSTETPIDLSQTISSQMATRFPGRYLVMTPLDYCVRPGSASGGERRSLGDVYSPGRDTGLVSEPRAGAVPSALPSRAR